jgi:hypothetical protein
MHEYMNYYLKLQNEIQCTERKLFVDIPWYVIHVINQSKCPRVYLAVLEYPSFYQLFTTFNGLKIISEVAKDN